MTGLHKIIPRASVISGRAPLACFSGLLRGIVLLAAPSVATCRPSDRVRMRSAKQKILQVVESVLDEIPSPHFVAGSTKPIRVALPPNGSEPLSWPGGVQRLLDVCTQAPCGRGSETVTDLSIRRVMQTTEATVEWLELEDVLQEVEARLLPGTSLQAEFDKLLVYGPGDFFKAHMDSKRCDDHVATLIAVADCPHTGGEIVFGEADTEVARWEGGGASWCCWLSSSKHEILPISGGRGCGLKGSLTNTTWLRCKLRQ